VKITSCHPVNSSSQGRIFFIATVQSGDEEQKGGIINLKEIGAFLGQIKLKPSRPSTYHLRLIVSLVIPL
jgi:hypothetical protein